VWLALNLCVRDRKGGEKDNDSGESIRAHASISELRKKGLVPVPPPPGGKKAMLQPKKKGAEGLGALPDNWQAGVHFTQLNFFSSKPCKQELENARVLSAPTPGVRIEKITDKNHPCCGQRGVFATELIPQNKVLGW
jgi:hypothetical protein